MPIGFPSRALAVAAAVAAIAGVLPAIAPAAPAEPLTVSGRVLADGRPAAGVRVELGPLEDSYAAALRTLDGEPWRPIATTTSGPDGRFALTAPGPGMWRVRLTHDGHVPVEQQLVPLVAPASLPDAELERDAGFAVTVLDPEGRPQAGASVRVLRSLHLTSWRRSGGGWWAAPRAGTADERGRVVLPRRPGEGLGLAAWAPGRLESVVETGEGAGTATLRLAPGVERTVRLGHGDQARGGVVVRVGKGRFPAGISGEDGTLRLALAAAGPTRLAFDAGGGWRTPAAEHTPPGATDEEPSPPLPVELPTPWLATGQVTAADDGRALPGALVWPEDDPAAVVRADDRGAFRLVRVGRETVRLRAAAPGYHVAEQGAAPAQAQAALFVLEPDAAVAGVVVDFTGRPVPGAEVVVRSDEGSWRPWTGAAAGRSWAAPDGSPTVRTWSDEAGRFRFRSRRAGEEVEVRAAAPGLAPAVVRATAGGEPVQIVLAEGRAVRGRLVGASGEPVAGASVGLAYLPADRSRTVVTVDDRRLFDHETTSDGEGAFVLSDLPAGRYDAVIDARPAWALRELVDVEVPEDRGVDLDEIVLEPAVSLELRVVDPLGEPVEGAGVTESPHRPLGLAHRGGSRHSHSTGSAAQRSTGADGRIRIDGLAPGAPLDLLVAKQGWLPTELPQIAPPLDDELEVVLDRGLTVRGRVIADDGRPAAGAGVVLRQEWSLSYGSSSTSHSSSHHGSADEEGSFRFEGLRPSPTLQLAATWEGLAGKLVVDDPPQRGELPPVVLRLEPAPRLIGTVADGEGQPVAGASITVLTGSVDRAGQRHQASARSDALGRFDLVLDHPGNVRLTAERDGLKDERELVLGSGTTTVELVLDEPDGLWLSGRVLDPEGRVVANVSLSLRCVDRCSEGQHATGLGTSGEFLVADLRPGIYEVEATVPGFAPARHEAVDLSRGPVRGLELVLRRGARIEGELSGLDAAALAGVAVTAEPADGPGVPFAGSVGHGGRYRVEGLAPGRWRVTAASATTGHRATGEIEIPERAEIVRLDLDLETAGRDLTGRLTVDGAPASGAVLRLVAEEGGAVVGTRTAFDGGFLFAGLEPGRYRLEVIPDFRVPAATRVLDLVGDEDVQLDLTAAAVSGTVVVPGGTATAGLHVVLTARDDSRQSTAVGSDGRFHVSPVAAGSYVLTIERDGTVLASQALEVGPLDIQGLVLIVE